MKDKIYTLIAAIGCALIAAILFGLKENTAAILFAIAAGIFVFTLLLKGFVKQDDRR